MGRQMDTSEAVKSAAEVKKIAKDVMAWSHGRHRESTGNTDLILGSLRSKRLEGWPQ
jgi:hypothetical protein